MHKIDYAGMEVSAEQLVVGRRCEGRLEPWRVFANTPPGHQAILRPLVRPGRVVRVGLESTGLYGLDLARVLSRQPGIEVRVTHPRPALRDHFATALMRRRKTDLFDARGLVEFGARLPFRPWTPPALHWQALARRLADRPARQSTEKNRLPAARLSEALPAAVRRDLERSLRSQPRALVRLTREAVPLCGIAQDPLCFPRWRSAHGIAETSAVQILAEWAGLSPHRAVRPWVARGPGPAPLPRGLLGAEKDAPPPGGQPPLAPGAL